MRKSNKTSINKPVIGEVWKINHNIHGIANELIKIIDYPTKNHPYNPGTKVIRYAWVSFTARKNKTSVEWCYGVDEYRYFRLYATKATKADIILYATPEWNKLNVK